MMLALARVDLPRTVMFNSIRFPVKLGAQLDAFADCATTAQRNVPRPEPQLTAEERKWFSNVGIERGEHPLDQSFCSCGCSIKQNQSGWACVASSIKAFGFFRCQPF